MMNAKANTIDEYIAHFPADVQQILEQVRVTIKEAAPLAEERISYTMPAFALYGIVIYFAGHKNHIGVYPTAKGIEAFKEELSAYKSSKGAVQFPLGEPMPLELIARITKFMVKHNIEKAKK